MFRTVMVTCLVVLLGTFAYYGRGAAVNPADLTFVNQSHVNTLDPQQMSWTSDIRIALNIWEGLTKHDPDTLQPIAGMADLPPEVDHDGREYTFSLRTDTRWSNGDPVTAHDFVRGWRRAIEPGTAADYAEMITNHIAGARAYYDWRNSAVKRLAELQSNGRSGEKRAFLEQHAREMDRQWRQVGIVAQNDHTLVVRLTRPTPYFLDLTLLPVTMPIHRSIERLRESVGALGLDENGLVIYDSQWTKPDYHRDGYAGLVTNGPYRITSWQFRRRLRLARNPHYYDVRDIALDRVDVMMFESANTAFQAYETGVVDWLTDLSVNYAGALLSKRLTGERPDVHLAPALGTYFYNLNCTDDRLPDGRLNPFTDARVRKALAISVDRQALCANVAEKHNPPLDTLIPPGSIVGYPALSGHPYDPALAGRLLDQAGYGDRSTFPEVAILYNTGYIHERIAEAIAWMWRDRLRIRVRLEGKENKTFAEDKAKHNFQIARAAWYGDYADPTTFLDIFATGNGNNDSGYSNPGYDALLQRAADCPDPRQRLRTLAEAERILIGEDFPLIPIYQYTNPQAFRPYVKGIRPNPREIYLLRYIRVER